MTPEARRTSPNQPSENQESIPLWVHGFFYLLPFGLACLAVRSLGDRHFLACLGYLMAALLTWKLARWIWELPAKALLRRVKQEVQREEAARQMDQ